MTDEDVQLPAQRASACPVSHRPPGVPASSVPAPQRPWGVDLDEAAEFLGTLHAEHPRLGSARARLARVRAEVERTGTYRHTPTELVFGARAAWRASARCIGRLYWNSLVVRDLRHVTSADEVAAECVAHLRQATNGGRIRPVISVFPPEAPGRPAPRIHNEQLVRYAGYRRPDGTVLGDPRTVEFTAALRARGWAAPAEPGPFDVLPLAVETAADGVRLHDLPDDAVLEVPLRHPELPWFADLGLRWHAVPAISNMRLRIGGVDYPAAPFNGWYMGTEIGARNLADPDRYDLLPGVARRLGMDTSSDRTLWKDRALVELNIAVLHSFEAAGVTITDHHTESRRFLAHLEREERAGRSCPADWSWIVPPISGAATPVFHRYYDEPTGDGPAYVLDADAVQRASTGRPVAFPRGADRSRADRLPVSA